MPCLCGRGSGLAKGRRHGLCFCCCVARAWGHQGHVTATSEKGRVFPTVLHCRAPPPPALCSPHAQRCAGGAQHLRAVVRCACCAARAVLCFVCAQLSSAAAKAGGGSRAGGPGLQSCPGFFTSTLPAGGEGFRCHCSARLNRANERASHDLLAPRPLRPRRARRHRLLKLGCVDAQGNRRLVRAVRGGQGRASPS